MMINNQYHCFISGLPDISFDSRRAWIDIPDFKRMLKENLQPHDYRQAEMVFLEDDNRTLARFMAGDEIENGGAGNYTIDDYREQLEIFSAILPPDDILPDYMVEVIREVHEAEDERKADILQTEHRLAEGYYSYIMANGSPFLKAFTQLNYNIKNLVAFIKAGEHGMEQERFITGSAGHAAHLRNYAGRNLSKDPEFEFFDEIISYSSTASFAEEERKYDRLRWQQAEDMTFFEDFSIDRILGYLQKMRILARWSPLDKNSGEEKLRDIVNSAWQEPAAPEGSAY
ncbi:MAG: DUF2764 family protein [Bacteroidales bacterium]|nr:DUF2764 family protein [Bacteroidales bacterium]